MMRGEFQLNRIHILGIPVDSLTMEETIVTVEKAIENGNKTRIITANAEMIMQAQDHGGLRNCLEKATLVVPDGAGVVWAAKEIGSMIPERVAGIDLAKNLMQMSAQKGFGVYFFGAAPGIAQLAAENIRKSFPELSISGIRDGFYSEADEDQIIKEINDSGAKLLFVALGSPKQELWLEKYRDSLSPMLHMGVGGSFDVFAGKVDRAPKWMQKNSLEWLYRALGQPSRWKRLLALPKFVFAVKKQKKLDNK